MVERRKFDFERLDKYCNENNVKLVENYSKTKLTKNVVIKGKCNYESCKNYFEKRFCELEKTGGYCKICIKIISNDRRQLFCLEKYGVDNVTKICAFKKKINSPKYNNELLQDYCKQNSISLCKNYQTEKLHANYFIKGKCSNDKCVNVFNKKFNALR